MGSTCRRCGEDEIQSEKDTDEGLRAIALIALTIDMKGVENLFTRRDSVNVL